MRIYKYCFDKNVRIYIGLYAAHKQTTTTEQIRDLIITNQILYHIFGL